ncbi:hypothetical protein DICVIV_07347 [Dictyocaulus viviparus]|uniref:Uncharacterized protein n=1 Tax=Dictyocaulus viviparus TaxID=29172 RepID=A0A0D8XS25_DICVI|nr:hypothetical protein DICVIV_07347 [Dictyocaulus viviparus]
MFIWMLLPLVKVSTRPIKLPFIKNGNDSVESSHQNRSFIDLAAEKRPKQSITAVIIDPSMFISLRENDWRDNHPKKIIIWSPESSHHPDFGKSYFKGRSLR